MDTTIWEDKLPLKTYLLGDDDPNPPWQKHGPDLIWPYSMQDNLLDEARVLDYRALHLENDYLHCIVLPELGGHMYSLYDKVGKREVFYRNNVVKYGLVARRGAWLSGGIEFNFPKGHTCLTVAPVLSELREEEAAIRIGGLDRTSRMRWGVKLSLDGAKLRQEVTLENPTPVRHWHYFWSNSAVPATDDLHLVYPAVKARTGGGVHCYPTKDGVDLSWYKNHDHANDIFTLDVHDDFFGCYYEDQDHGMVHWSDHNKNFGKKFFTWGTADDGMIWVDLLTDDDGQYVEIQAGRFVDQGTFEWLSPFQQVSWVEQWWPVREMGGWNWANEEAALHLKPGNGQADIAAYVTTCEGAGELVLEAEGQRVWSQACRLQPATPVKAVADLPQVAPGAKLSLALYHDGELVVRCDSPAGYERRRAELVIPAPTPPKPPVTAQEHCLEAETHLKLACDEAACDLYEKALTLEPDHAVAHFGLGWLDYNAGLYESARDHLVHATEQDAEHDQAWYSLALTDLQLGRREEAEIVLWRLVGRTACHDEASVILAQLALQDGEPVQALDLLAFVRPSDAVEILRAQAGEPPHPLAQLNGYDLLHEEPQALDRLLLGDPEEYLELALVLVASGDTAAAVQILRQALELSERARQYPLVYYYLAALDADNAAVYLGQGRIDATPAYCFPSRLEDLTVLTQAAAAAPQDWVARLLLGTVLAGLGRNDEALANWQTAASLCSTDATLCRNIGLGLTLCQKQPAEALSWYDRAIANTPGDYHQYLERDLVMQAAEQGPEKRLAALATAPPAVGERWEIAARKIDCLLGLERWGEALELLQSKSYKPWEGARGMHDMWVQALAGQAQHLRECGDLTGALQAYELALTYPRNLGVGRVACPEEAKVHWLIAEVAGELGQPETQQEHLQAAADERHTRTCEADLYKQRALAALGRLAEAEALAHSLRLWSAERLEKKPQNTLALQIRNELGVEV